MPPRGFQAGGRVVHRRGPPHQHHSPPPEGTADARASSSSPPSSSALPACSDSGSHVHPSLLRLFSTRRQWRGFLRPRRPGPCWVPRRRTLGGRQLRSDRIGSIPAEGRRGAGPRGLPEPRRVERSSTDMDRSGAGVRDRRSCLPGSCSSGPRKKSQGRVIPDPPSPTWPTPYQAEGSDHLEVVRVTLDGYDGVYLDDRGSPDIDLAAARKAPSTSSRCHRVNPRTGGSRPPATRPPSAILDVGGERGARAVAAPGSTRSSGKRKLARMGRRPPSRPRRPAPARGRPGGSTRPEGELPTVGCRGLLEALVEPRTDVVGGELRTLAPVPGDDDSGGGDTGQAGDTQDLPELHEQESLRWIRRC